MFEVMIQWLEFLLVIAILVIFFGLVARTNLRAARIVGWFSIAWALAVVIVEGYGWHSKGDWVITPAKQIWYQLSRTSLNMFEAGVEHYLSASAAAVAEWILTWPAWAVLSLIGVFFLVYDHVQLQRQHKGAPPPPLWKRAYRWVREAFNPDEEQAGA